MLDYSDRIVVMRDGKVVAADSAAAFDRDKLVATMGGAHRATRAAARGGGRGRRGGPPVRVRARPERQRTTTELVAHEGEIIGLAGLAGHGQTRTAAARSSSGAAAPRRPHRGDRAGRPHRRRPAGGRHLSALVDRGEHRHPLDRGGSATAS